MRTFSLFLLFFLPLVISAQTNTDSPSGSSSVSDIYVGGPEAPVITSLDYPSADTWFKLEDLTFGWEMPEEVVAVAADVFINPDEEPMTTYRPPVSSITIPSEDLIEGYNYLSVQFKNEEKWGMYGGKVVKIDNTPPEPFSITTLPLDGGSRGAALISFEAQDLLSGISHYEFSINGSIPSRLSPIEAARGQMIDLNNNTQYSIKAVAYDQAGNAREENVSILGITPTVVPPNNVIDLAVEDPAAVLAAIMAALLLIMFGYIVYERQRYAESLHNLRIETDEIHDQLLRIFSALREEIHQQIRNISKKARLSKKEQEAVEGLNKALSISESLIDREIKDVKNLLD